MMEIQIAFEIFHDSNNYLIKQHGLSSVLTDITSEQFLLPKVPGRTGWKQKNAPLRVLLVVTASRKKWERHNSAIFDRHSVDDRWRTLCGTTRNKKNVQNDDKIKRTSPASPARLFLFVTIVSSFISDGRIHISSLPLSQLTVIALKFAILSG